MNNTEQNKTFDQAKIENDAIKYARELYPMANVDDYPDNPNVNRTNKASVSSVMNGVRFVVERLKAENKKYFDVALRVQGEYQECQKIGVQLKSSFEQASARTKELEEDNEHNIKRALEIAGERDTALERIKKLESELKFEIGVANAQAKIATEGQKTIQELEEENKRLKAALTEVKEIEYDYSQSKTTLCATLWHVIKVASKAISPSTNEKE
jgi:cell shape-determining protein MreC